MTSSRKCIEILMTQNNEPASFRVVAIDGGAASGKSSTSKRLAQRFGFLHVDTGSHYRAVTCAGLEEGLDPSVSDGLASFIARLRLESRIEGNECLLSLNGRDPLTDEQLRSSQVNAKVSGFAALPMVRDAVKAYQRDQVRFARDNGFNGIVMDGRDIGTVILPDADVKVFLYADEATRQRRRELEGGQDTVSHRDQQDSSRATAPLKAADDAIVIDNSGIDLEQVVDRIASILQDLT